MKKRIAALALVLVAGMPAAAMYQPGQSGKQAAPHVGVPHTVHSELMLFRDTQFNGEAEVVETPSSTVHTDWPIKSIAVHPGDTWQICGRARFREPCILLNRSVPDASMIGVDDQIGSARLAPTPAPHQ